MRVFSLLTTRIHPMEPLCGECSHPSTYQQPPCSLHRWSVHSTRLSTRYTPGLLVPLTHHIRECLYLIVDIALLVDETLDLTVGVHDRCMVASSKLTTDLR